VLWNLSVSSNSLRPADQGSGELQLGQVEAINCASNRLMWKDSAARIKLVTIQGQVLSF
jgi:hypothetical protein